MVLAQDVDGSTPAERAAKLAALVKASVRPVDAFSGKCSSGGHLDLRVASGNFVPVVSGARMESDGDAALVMVEGSYFGALRVREACTSAARRLRCAPGRTAPS